MSRQIYWYLVVDEHYSKSPQAANESQTLLVKFVSFQENNCYNVTVIDE